MRITFLKYWDRLLGSFWFLPIVMAGAAVALAYATIALDRTTTVGWVRAQSWAYNGSAEGATAMLGTIASSMITIAGVVFSMTLVVLSLASSQLGPRLLRGFMTDKGTQVVLGTFQLVEIAVRALSPGVNDPFTAVACVDRLGAALSRLAQREMPSPCRRDAENKLRVVTPATAFADFADAAFDQVRQYARSSAAVTLHLLSTIAVVADFAHRPEDRAVLRRHAEMIARGSLEGLPEQEDRHAVEARFLAAMQSLETGSTDRH